MVLVDSDGSPVLRLCRSSCFSDCRRYYSPLAVVAPVAVLQTHSVHLLVIDNKHVKESNKNKIDTPFGPRFLSVLNLMRSDICVTLSAS
jgi:hypothetical protein